MIDACNSIRVCAEDIPLDRLASNPNLSEKEKVTELSRQFEAVLLRQILNEARKPVFESEFCEQSSASDIYYDMFTNQLAESISRSGDFGLGTSLETQLARQVTARQDSDGAPSSTDPLKKPIHD